MWVLTHYYWAFHWIPTVDYFELFNLKLSIFFALSLNVKQFYLTHRTQWSSTTADQSGPGSNGNEELLHIFEIPKEPRHQMGQCYFSVTRWWGSLTSLLRFSQCILQPKLTRASKDGLWLKDGPFYIDFGKTQSGLLDQVYIVTFNLLNFFNSSFFPGVGLQIF